MACSRSQRACSTTVSVTSAGSSRNDPRVAHALGLSVVARKPVPPSPRASFRLRITSGDDIAVGPGKVDLLEAIDATGSISAAARSLGMSYRRAWLLVDTMNRCFRAPVVAAEAGGKRGGGTHLTP